VNAAEGGLCLSPQERGEVKREVRACAKLKRLVPFTSQLNILFNSPPGKLLANSENVPFSAISFDDFMKPAQATRASVPPTLMRRTPRAPASASDGRPPRPGD